MLFFSIFSLLKLNSFQHEQNKTGKVCIEWDSTKAVDSTSLMVLAGHCLQVEILWRCMA